MENKALWLAGPGKTPYVGPADLYKPGEGELLVRVGYS